ncbi:MAG: hypothetical protein CML24_02125 [Rhizobiales bacterium]|nr:hypothetical protein [Hyphomicrobiales bacterium]
MKPTGDEPVNEPTSHFVDALVEMVNGEGDVVVPEGSSAADPVKPVEDGWDDPYNQRKIKHSRPGSRTVQSADPEDDDELPAFLFAETFVKGKR